MQAEYNGEEAKRNKAVNKMKEKLEEQYHKEKSKLQKRLEMEWRRIEIETSDKLRTLEG